MKNGTLTYNIERHIGILSTSGSWTTELNFISWDGRPAKYDIRAWSNDHSRMSKGICLTEAEAKNLCSLLGE